jgi:hypothetical protein
MTHRCPTSPRHRGVRATRIAMLAALLPALQGCPALLATQLVPGMMGTIAMTGAEDRNPFRTMMPPAPPRTADELAALDEHLHMAECGDPGSQYWVGSALKNGYNAKPDNVEIRKWFLLAQNGGVDAAAEELAALDATMTTADIGEAETRARAWQPKTEGCEASS